MIKRICGSALLVSGLVAGSAFAQSGPSCQDYLAMDEQGQMEAAEQLKSSMESGDSLDTQQIATTAQQGCAENPDGDVATIVQDGL